MRRALLAVILLATGCAWLVPAARSLAAPGCAPGGTPAPADAAQRQVGDLDGDGRPDTLWVGQFRGGPPEQARTVRVIGVTTASGANSDAEVSSASPIPLSALAVDAQNDGGNQIIVSDGRGARLFTFADCRLQTVVDSHYGRPFLFDMQDLRNQGTGVGCSDLGDGRRLVALRAAQNGNQWAVRRTEIDLSGIRATTGKSDTVTAASAQDPAVTTAQTISCGDLTISKDGIQQP